jgi:hypothetical protein
VPARDSTPSVRSRTSGALEADTKQNRGAVVVTSDKGLWLRAVLRWRLLSLLGEDYRDVQEAVAIGWICRNMLPPTSCASAVTD